MKWSKTINVPYRPRGAMVNVPSWWIDQMNIQPGDNRLTMTVDENTGNLVIRPTEKAISEKAS